jgi:hypothetical protein
LTRTVEMPAKADKHCSWLGNNTALRHSVPGRKTLPQILRGRIT